MTNTTEPATDTRVVVRLEASIYAKLEQKLSRTVVTAETTPITLGYSMGVEAVLKELRNGFVVGTA